MGTKISNQVLLHVVSLSKTPGYSIIHFSTKYFIFTICWPSEKLIKIYSNYLSISCVPGTVIGAKVQHSSKNSYILFFIYC